FIILGQKSSYDDSKAAVLRNLIFEQARSLGKNVEVLLPHRDLPEIHGFWAIWPLFRRILSLVSSDWYVFLESDSIPNAGVLFYFLGKFHPGDRIFLGHGLKDKEPTIIHHFHGFDSSEEDRLLYPDFAGGVVLSKGLIAKLFRVLFSTFQIFLIFLIYSLTDAMKASGEIILNSFAIDAKHELALLVYKISGVTLSSYPLRFCLSEKDGCAISYKESLCQPEIVVSQANMFVAVKTFSGNHDTRLPVIKSTWGSSLPHIVYFSDRADDDIPTVESGVPNKERGHCAKTFAILKHFSKIMGVTPSRSGFFSWLLIVDDDTLVSISRLLRLLSCYNSNEKIIIGERYGYGFSTSGFSGYDYPTGGSGMVFSVPAVHAIVSECECPTEDSPDDMIIGVCARRTGIVIVHNAAFHQARHIDYPEAYIRRLPPISFHKFEDIDPLGVFMAYLHE
ncbi:hypothetical protein Angca_007383, partial [Angiostrongylus cantonensis]